AARWCPNVEACDQPRPRRNGAADKEEWKSQFEISRTCECPLRSTFGDPASLRRKASSSDFPRLQPSRRHQAVTRASDISTDILDSLEHQHSERTMRNRWFALALALAGPLSAAVVPVPSLAQEQPHNVILCGADGLRPGMVNEQNAPALAALMKNGVHFPNTHAMFPTFTTANAASLATGHKVGDSGDFSNTVYTGFAVPSAGYSVTPF